MSEQNMSRAAALKAVGFWQPVDTLACFLIALNALSLIVTASVGGCSMVAAFVWLVIVLILVALWIVVLVFRTMWFVLQITAEIKMMPSAASKMVLAFLSGQGTPQR